VPGLRFFHEGQLDGRRQHASIHLGRRPAESPDPAIIEFYRRLLECLRLPVVRDGDWRLLECRPAWDDNPTWRRFIAFTWEEAEGERLLVTVNYGPTQGQCYVRLPWEDLRGRQCLLKDSLGTAAYERDGSDLTGRGLYLDMPAWHFHVFEIRPA
jgi:hypothetical protein